MEASRIGPFALEQKLSADGSGSVYHAIHVDQKKPVALKVFWAPMVASADNAKLEFWNDFDTLKGLTHPNIVRCFGGEVEPEYGWVALELVRGGTLATFLHSRKRLPWELVVDISRRIAAALHHAHEHKVTHGGLAPDKVLLSASGQVKIAGFLMDKICGTDYATACKGSIDKAMFLSPEQIVEPPHVTHKSDLYTLGCMMYQMLTGRPPFSARTVDQVLKQHLRITPPRVSTIVLDCPVWLDVLVRQLLEKKPDDRPRLASAVVLALDETKRKVAAGTSVTEHALSGISPLETGASKKEAHKVLGRKTATHGDSTPFYEQTWFLAAGLALLIVMFGWFLWPASEKSLFEKADMLMATENDNGEWQKARRHYIEPLLKRYPNGHYAEQARQHLDLIDMDRAERRMQIRIRQGREPTTEGERLYAEAWNYEHFGDRITSLEKYRSIVALLQEGGPDRPYVNLARRQIQKLEEGESIDDRLAFLEERLSAADQLANQGKLIEARGIWRSLVTLYSNHQEYIQLIATAESRLAGQPTAEK